MRGFERVVSYPAARDNHMEIGDTIMATVSDIQPFGVFLEFNAYRILVLITDLSDGVVQHPSFVVEQGQDVCVTILRYNAEDDVYRGKLIY